MSDAKASSVKGARFTWANLKLNCGQTNKPDDSLKKLKTESKQKKFRITRHNIVMKMAIAIKTMVSKKKNRHKEGKFNLDLSYISDRVIAMGFPAENFESIYRNSLDDVREYLDEKHKDHYWIYNLCSERMYDPKKFYDRVSCHPFDDHHPPNFGMIM